MSDEQMTRDSNTCQISIYKADTIYEIDRIDEILLQKRYVKQRLLEENIDGFTFRLYHQKYPAERTPDWKKVLKRIVRAGQSVIQPTSSIREGFVLLIEKSRAIYLVAGGNGFHAVQNLIDEDFGIDVISRMIKRQDKIIKSAREKSVIGNILGMTKYFRTNYNLSENEEFGKIYHELEATLDKGLLRDKFGFTPSDLKRELVCIAKSSFRIKRKISFDQILKVILGCESLLADSSTVVINSVRKLSKARDEVLINELDSILLTQLWMRYQGDQESYSFDVCHREFEKYLTADKYLVRKGASQSNIHDCESLRNVDEIFENIRSGPNGPEDQAAFNDLIASLRIISLDEDRNDLTSALLKQHLFGDVSRPSGGKYFLIDGSWYEIKDTFINELNEVCEYFIHNAFYDAHLNVWLESDRENEYSCKEIGNDRTIVLDQILPDNIEPCDILKWDDDNLYLFHVKAGFGNTMRDLCSQVFLSASRIVRDVKTTEKAYIKSIYRTLRNKIGGSEYFNQAGQQTNGITEDQFVELFDKKLSFVLAVSDRSNRDIRRVRDFDSNIAKFSLQLLSMQMKGIDASLKVCQIQRSAVPREPVAA